MAPTGRRGRRGTQRHRRRESFARRGDAGQRRPSSARLPAAPAPEPEPELAGEDLEIEEEDAAEASAGSDNISEVVARPGGSNRAAALRSTRLTSAGGRGQMQPRGRSLRSKFMLAFAGVTGISLIALGIVLSWVSNFFLFSQTQHKGVELAKMTSALYQSLNEMCLRVRPPILPSQTEPLVQRYLKAATTWGDGERPVTHITATNCGGLDRVRGLGIGQVNTAISLSEAADTMYVPGVGRVVLGEDVKFFEFNKVIQTTSGSRSTPVYRFQVGIRQPGGDDWMPTDSHYVTVDMDISNVYAVRNMLILVIAAFLLVSLVVVLIVANAMANKITRPVRILLHDINQVAQGDLDYQTRTHSDDEIGMLAYAFNIMTQDLKQATANLVEQEAEQKRAEYEMATAREVQQQLLPAQKPTVPGYEIESFYRGAKAVSGDYYDFIKLGDNLVGYIIADVSGKGIPGSMVMAVMRTIVRLIAAQHGDGAADTLKRTNRLIARQIKRGMFVTAFYAILDTTSHTLTFASAGHNPMVIFRAAQQGYELANAKGIAIGFDSGPVFDKNIQEYRVQLSPGDSFVLYTDGFPEAMNEQNQEFGEQNFYKAITLAGVNPATEMVRVIVGAIERHRGAADQSDDLTMMIVRRTE